MKRNQYCFGLGTLGRDAVYTLVSMYFITFLTVVSVVVSVITLLWRMFR